MAIKRKKIQKVSQNLMRLLPRKSAEGPNNLKKATIHSENKRIQQFPIIGIGASAGGLAAFEAFFSGMPATTDPNMAFVLVQHLAPDHKSILTGLIQRYTRMQVFEVQDGMEVKVNYTYIIPPGRNMSFHNGLLRLSEPSGLRGDRLPIDFFFRSLAKNRHEQAIGIVLSGTGNDGALGIRDIKGEGGRAMAQSPDSAEYGEMPQNAIDTGLVDFVLSPADMPAQLADMLALLVKKSPANGLHLHRVEKKTGFGKLSLRELTERTLLQQVAPTGALVNAKGDILYLHGRTGMYLEPTPGDISVNNILEMARDGLRHELALVLHEVTTSKETMKRTGLRISSNGAFIIVNLTIRPVVTGPGTLNEAPLYLVILEEVPQINQEAINDEGLSILSDLDASVYIASLRQELRTKEQHLQTANEELKSSMEEMQLINEELQSTNEELETSKEELQSVNKELATVNAELQTYERK